MYTRSMKLAAVASAFCIALTALSGAADAATTKKKKKKQHRYNSEYSHRQPTPAEYNQCRWYQFTYPTQDIRC